MKKTIFWLLVLTLVFAFITCQTTGSGRSDGIPYNITNNFAQDSSTSFLVQWHNGARVSSQVLQIIEEDGDFVNAANINVTGIRWNPTRTPENKDVGDYEPRNIFRAEVSGLKPATKYKYRVGTPGKWSDTFFHLTSNGSIANFSFTVGADTQDRLFQQMRSTFKAANEYDADNRFFLVAGDLVDYPQDNTDEYPNYTIAANDFNIRTPIVTTQGNHDTYIKSNPNNRDEYTFGNAEVYNSFIVFPENGWDQGEHASPHRSKSYYFYYNEVLFIMLNTMATQNATGRQEPNHTAQTNWLREILQHDKDNNLSKYIIVVTHIPFFTGRGSSSTGEPWLLMPTRAAYAGIISEYNVDLFFFGHEHVYTRSNPIKIGTNTAIAAINFNTVPNGTIYSIAGSIGPKTYTFRNHPANPAAAPIPTDMNSYIPNSWPVRTDQQSPGMFINVKVTAERLIVTARRLNQAADVDRYEVRVKR